jgi:hypothetical protein
MRAANVVIDKNDARTPIAGFAATLHGGMDLSGSMHVSLLP